MSFDLFYLCSSIFCVGDQEGDRFIAVLVRRTLVVHGNRVVGRGVVREGFGLEVEFSGYLG